MTQCEGTKIFSFAFVCVPGGEGHGEGEGEIVWNKKLQTQ